MSRSYTTRKIVKKSSVWHRHGKHAKMDPRLIANDRRAPRNLTEWFASMAELLGRSEDAS